MLDTLNQFIIRSTKLKTQLSAQNQQWIGASSKKHHKDELQARHLLLFLPMAWKKNLSLMRFEENAKFVRKVAKEEDESE